MDLLYRLLYTTVLVHRRVHHNKYVVGMRFLPTYTRCARTYPFFVQPCSRWVNYRQFPAQRVSAKYIISTARSSRPLLLLVPGTVYQ